MKHCIGFVTESNSKNRHLPTWHLLENKVFSLNTVFQHLVSAAKNQFIRLKIEIFRQLFKLATIYQQIEF